MGRYRTCVGCQFEGLPCAERNKVREKLAGLGVTSLKWKCDWRKPRFSPGEPVFVSLVTHWGRDDGGEDHAETDTFPGIFVQQAKAPSKAIVYIAPGALSVHGEPFVPVRDGNGFCRLSQSYLTRREGVPDHVCEQCSNPVSVLGHAGYCRHYRQGQGETASENGLAAEIDLSVFA